VVPSRSPIINERLQTCVAVDGRIGNNIDLSNTFFFSLYTHAASWWGGWVDRVFVFVRQQAVRKESKKEQDELKNTLRIVQYVG
jgi:hypothetical protein